ncbi:MAG: hypothetical protein GXP37_00490 [Chloroflexi bacterium]|nr:hypothetical protein [Chloroflexota bacterium]
MSDRIRMAILIGSVLVLLGGLFVSQNVSRAATPFQSPLSANTIHEPLVLGADGITQHASRLESGGIPLYAIVLFILLLIPTAAMTAVRRRR